MTEETESQVPSESPFGDVKIELPTKTQDIHIGPDIIGVLTAKVAQAVESTFVVGAVEYAVTVSAIPGDQGQPVAVGLIVLAIPSIEIGQKIHTTLIVQNLWVNQDEVDTMVRQATEALLDARSQMATVTP